MTSRLSQPMRRVCNPPAALRDDALPVAYLAARLGVAKADVPIPRTPLVGHKTLAYYDPPPPGPRAKPKQIGTFPCDGGLLTEAGYDRQSGLLFDPGDTSFPSIPY